MSLPGDANFGILKNVLSWLGEKLGQRPPESPPTADDSANPCCTPVVHIAYRGKSDDRLYMAYNRKWQEVRFFQPDGLRVFCSECRRRVY